MIRRGIQTIDQLEVHVLPGEGGMEWDHHQIRGIQTIDQVHVLPGENGIG